MISAALCLSGDGVLSRSFSFVNMHVPKANSPSSLGWAHDLRGCGIGWRGSYSRTPETCNIPGRFHMSKLLLHNKKISSLNKEIFQISGSKLCAPGNTFLTTDQQENILYSTKMNFYSAEDKWTLGLICLHLLGVLGGFLVVVTLTLKQFLLTEQTVESKLTARIPPLTHGRHH